MERIGLLISKLQELHQQNAAPDQILCVLQMLQTELTQLMNSKVLKTEKKMVSVFMPAGAFQSSTEALSTSTATPTEIIGMAERSIAEEIESIQREAALKEKTREALSTQQQIRFNALEEVPTLAHQPRARELNEVIGETRASLNDKLNDSRAELADRLQDQPVKDIKKAIGVNDRFTFIMELFRGDEAMYERSLKTINHFMIFPEAEFWIQRELKLKLGWNVDHPAVQLFDQIVRRRFL